MVQILQPEAMESRKLPYKWRSKAMESRKLPYKWCKSMAKRYGITQITIQIAQIYSQKLWNHINYHTNSANL
jgi:hypothetical protein